MRNESFLSMRKYLKAAGLALMLFALPAGAAPPSEGYSIVKKIAIPGQGSWDYLSVDEGARRLSQDGFSQNIQPAGERRRRLYSCQTSQHTAAS